MALFLLIDQIQTLLPHLFVTAYHVFREANQVADFLTSLDESNVHIFLVYCSFATAV